MPYENRSMKLKCKTKYSFWEIVILAGLLYIAIFIILRMFGVIKTPALIEESPFLVGIGVGISVYKWLKDSFTKLEIKIMNVENGLGNKITKVQSDLDNVEKDVEQIKSGLKEKN